MCTLLESYLGVKDDPMNETIAIQLMLPKDTYQALQQTARRQSKSEADLAVTAIEAYLGQTSGIDPLWGLFADEPELIDQVVEQAMQDRERIPLRLTEDKLG